MRVTDVGKGFAVWFLLLCLAFPWTALPARGEAKTVTATTCIGCAPYLSPALKYNGVTARVVSEALALENINLKLLFLPWPRAVKMAENAEVDFVFPAVRTPKREKLFYFSDSVADSDRLLFFRRGFGLKWNSLDDLKGLTIAALRGYQYGQGFDAKEKSGFFRVERLDYPQQIIQMLLSGRVEVGILNNDVAEYTLELLFPKQKNLLAHHPKPLTSDFYYALTPKKRPGARELLKALNRGLEKLKASGKFDRYYQESRQGKYLPGN